MGQLGWRVDENLLHLEVSARSLKESGMVQTRNGRRALATLSSGQQVWLNRGIELFLPVLVIILGLRSQLQSQLPWGTQPLAGSSK